MPADAKSLIRRFYEEVSAGNAAVIDELLADAMIDHETDPGDPPGKVQRLGAIPEQAPA